MPTKSPGSCEPSITYTSQARRNFRWIALSPPPPNSLFAPAYVSHISKYKVSVVAGIIKCSRLRGTDGGKLLHKIAVVLRSRPTNARICRALYQKWLMCPTTKHRAFVCSFKCLRHAVHMQCIVAIWFRENVWNLSKDYIYGAIERGVTKCVRPCAQAIVIQGPATAIGVFLPSYVPHTTFTYTQQHHHGQKVVMGWNLPLIQYINACMCAPARSLLLWIMLHTKHRLAMFSRAIICALYV